MKMEMLIDDLQTLIDEAFTVPLSGGKTVVNTERLKEIIEEMRTNLPIEIKQAKSIAADRTNILNNSRNEAERIVQAAEDRARTMVQQSEIVKQAQQKANEIIFNANQQANQIKNAANTYVEGLMKKSDDELSKNLAELKKTRSGLTAYMKQNGGAKGGAKGTNAREKK